MTNKELIDSISQDTALTKKQTELLLRSTMNAISSTLQGGGSVLLQHFGTFELREQKERSVRNPRTGEMMTVPAKQTVNFKMNARLKEALKEVK